MKSFKEFLMEAAGLREAQLPDPLQEIIDDESKIVKLAVGITDRNKIPSTDQIPIVNPSAWLKIPDVNACYVDMVGSTKLSASAHPNSTAKLYRYFTNTAVRIFHEFDAPYIDIKGDGVFALFDSDRPHTALAAMVTIKSFVKKYFTPKAKELTGIEIGGHFGIDQKTVLVRKLGLKFHGDRTDRQNEVWAGKPINMAAKLASRTNGDVLLVSNRFHAKLKADKALVSCGCGSANGKPGVLWTEVDLSKDELFDFDLGHSLGSVWCEKHGWEYCRELSKFDETN
ncbi:hypothetical protein [Aestuariivirga litoralis]|uniref:hypothetical protein n=1 Tax=Aestuariivirga litoralis TaxID=2650924 RepID=UPI0018C6A1C1|nr:hypothetical protein [Aestuariivirga litoralis]MBG1231038.1 hypothetical protein [Aestuariivirga litoralis]